MSPFACRSAISAPASRSIAPSLAVRFDAPEEAIARDVEAFLAELRGKGLVED